MKKFFVLTIAIMMVLSMGVFAADYEVDIASITDFTENCVFVHEGASFDGVTINFFNGPGAKALLGDLDLSDYSKVVFAYGSDPQASYLPTDCIRLCDSEGNEIGRFTPSMPYGFWGTAIRESEIAIDSTYSGPVYVVTGLSSHGISISGVTFIEKGTEAPATEAPATEAPATDAPATEAPATDAPATAAPATDAPATAAPATDAPATNAPATNAPATSDDDNKKDDGGNNIIPIIIIVVVVIAAAAVAVVLVKKSKK